jgi:hypothetical protein
VLIFNSQSRRIQSIPFVRPSTPPSYTEKEQLIDLKNNIKTESPDTIKLAIKMIDIMGASAPISKAEILDLGRTKNEAHAILKSNLIKKIDLVLGLE